MTTNNKNFRVKNGLEVTGEIGVGSTPSYGTTGQILSSQGAGNAAAWIDVAPAASYTSVVKHDVRLAEAITKGQAVYVSSSNGSNMVVSKASNATESTSSKTLGLLESSGSTNNQRNVITEGLLGGIDVGAASAGDPIWLGTGGNLIYGLTNKPIAPAHLVFIGIVTKTGNNGEIFIRIQNGFELNELHTVLIGTDYTTNSIPGDNEFLAYNLGTNLWINQTAEEAGVANLSGATFTGNVAGTNISVTGNVNATTVNATTFTGTAAFANTAFSVAISNVSSMGTNVSTFLTTPNSINFLNTITDETGTGNVVFSTSPVLTTPNIGAAIGTSLNVTANVNASTLRLTSTDDVTTSSTTHAFQIGADSGNNIRIDDNEISRYNNGVVAQLTLNLDGGDVVVGASTSTVTISGNTKLGLAETQTVSNASWTSLTNTYTVNLASGNYFSNIALGRTAPEAAWTYVANTRATTTGASGTFTLPSGMQNGDYVAIVIGCDSTGTYPNVTTTTYGTWTVTSSGSTTHPARLFVKRITDAANETSVAYTTTAGATAIAAMAIRNTVSTATVINNTTAVSASYNPPATTTSYSNAAVFIAGFTRDIAVTAVTHANTAYNGNLAYISTSGLASGVNAAAMISFATIPVANIEDPATFTVTGGTAGNSAAFSAAISPYVDPTINLINGPTGTYVASTYVLHINNASNMTTTWSGATFAWQGGTAPTLSTIAPNNIVILETINGTTFRGALLDSYA